MQLVDGVHHVTFLTEDMDRLIAFYERVFGAEVTLDMTEEGLRRELRRRIEAEGAADGDVRDMKSHWIMGYFDPDGAAHEVML